MVLRLEASHCAPLVLVPSTQQAARAIAEHADVATRALVGLLDHIDVDVLVVDLARLHLVDEIHQRHHRLLFLALLVILFLALLVILFLALLVILLVLCITPRVM